MYMFSKFNAYNMNTHMQAPMHNTHTHTCRVVYQGTGAEVKVFGKRKHEPGEVLFAAAVA